MRAPPSRAARGVTDGPVCDDTRRGGVRPLAACHRRAFTQERQKGEIAMGSSSKRQTTWTKMQREQAVRERRLRKQEKRDLKKQARNAGGETDAAPPVDAPPVDAPR